jgi:hypothetical protein
MNATHIYREAPSPELSRVTAWRYDPEAARPVWVCRKFHDIGGEKGPVGLTDDGTLITLNPGDWVVLFLESRYMVFSAEQFSKYFSPI